VYLTCATINRLQQSARQALGDCCDMHRNVMTLYPHVQCLEARKSGGVLFRTMEQRGDTLLYLMSETQPDFSGVEWLNSSSARVRDVAPLRSVLATGKTLRFDLLAHPSKKVNAERKNSARVFLRTEDERKQWLARQGEKYGFSVDASQEKLILDLHGKRSTGPMYLKAVQFNGILRVTDPDMFWKGYTQGIGAEKSYGLGMLLLSAV
jgi:CRISPR system Cascade subunit CasE